VPLGGRTWRIDTAPSTRSCPGPRSPAKPKFFVSITCNQRFESGSQCLRMQGSLLQTLERQSLLGADLATHLARVPGQWEQKR
jgi:hypothetical protein